VTSPQPECGTSWRTRFRFSNERRLEPQITLGLLTDASGSALTVAAFEGHTPRLGKSSHHAVAIDSDGNTLWSKQIRNDQSAIEGLIARAVETAHTARWAVNLTSAEAALLLALLVAAE
jgi:Transposase